jgi:hypothetical protein
MRLLFIIITAFLITAFLCSLTAATLPCFAVDVLTNEQNDFFETRIRPVLVEQCYSCHNSTKQADASLELDHRPGLLEGGDGGKIVVPGKPLESRLLAILRHEIPGLKMPQGAAKLDKQVIADFEKWIEMGLPDPRDRPPTAEEIDKLTSWEVVLEKRKQWWSLQPVREVSPVSDVNNAWSPHLVDRFILDKLQEKQLVPNDPADANTLVRRLYFALVGLPPTAKESNHWVAELSRPHGYDALVEHLLNSPHFGERWARHWMDWIRYADSHGSEGDPSIENGWLYRDYLIRALNADIPYDQMVREHMAGDLLEPPRIDAVQGVNESLIATAHWRMVFHGFSPTDALDEKVRFIDDQINTFSKAFLGLTVSCARCHDHKFDAISQNDYYALFGIMSSCRPGRSAIETPEKMGLNRKVLHELKPRIRESISGVWLESVATLRDKLCRDDELWKKVDNKSVLFPWAMLEKDLSKGLSFADAWRNQSDVWEKSRTDREAVSRGQVLQRWNFARPDDLASWTRTGVGLYDNEPSTAGEFVVDISGDNALLGIYPAGIYSHRVSNKHPARLTSRDTKIDGEFDLWLRTIGSPLSSARFVVHDYPRKGVVFPTVDCKNQWQWQKLDMSYWSGDTIHVELSTAADAPLLVQNEPRSWFGVREVMIAPKGQSVPTDSSEHLDPWFEIAAQSPPHSREDAAGQFATAVEFAIQAWQKGSATDQQAILLDLCMKQDLLPSKLDELGDAKDLVSEYRRLEGEIPVPTRVPTLEETDSRTQALYVRGDHKKPGDEVSRGFLSAINASPYSTKQSGRLELAEDILRNDNPLTRRVIVNRLWHHLFGRGIVGTPDNFGRLGHLPSHPQLLDHLAARFQSQDGSLKEMIRYLVTSKTWQLSSRPSSAAIQADPDNNLLSHSHVKRLEAEAIRDSLLAVSGRLDSTLYGKPVSGDSNRRSVYLRVTRNALDPFLRAFDFPEPFSAVGRRDVTNVPAQSLTLMNDEHIASMATSWMTVLLADKATADDDRVRSMFIDALGRTANRDEIELARRYVESAKQTYAAIETQATELESQIQKRQSAIDQRLALGRAQILVESKVKPAIDDPICPPPIGRWDFESSAEDIVGSLHANLLKGATVNAGALIVDGKGYAVTEPLKQTLKEKTLEAWLQLDSFDQHGGGVMSVQSSTGGLFDAIVFAEKRDGQWIAGSNNFHRTQSFGGPTETEAVSRPVHIAIVYQLHGKVIGYRDGKPYGEPYQSNGPLEFKAGETIVSFGVRHLPAGGNRMLKGRILRAQLYDRALNPEQVIASAQSIAQYVSDSQILASLSETERKQVELDRSQVKEWKSRLEKLRPKNGHSSEIMAWSDLARAMFTFKEFIFVK